VSIAVWKNPDLSATVPVRPDGIVSAPLVGEVHAAGRTPADVQAELTEKYAAFVTAPGVSVVVTEIHSRKVYVMGEVGKSGEYDVFQPTRLMQILAVAGGLTEYAKKDEVVILRGQRRLVASIKDVSSGRRLEDNILLEPGDTIVVP
jgi:polysaccharide export outer membrane protein